MLYPGNKNKQYLKQTTYANRGMDLENFINEANNYYKVNDIAIIYKKPTPIAIGKIKYDGQKKVLTKGYFESKSTLDYVGLYKGRYIDFDAKSSQNKTAFPLANIMDHQINHIKSVIKHGGISFLIIEMNQNIYLLTGEDLLEFIMSNTRKSIPYDYIKSKGHLIKFNYNPVLNYIAIIDKIYS